MRSWITGALIVLSIACMAGCDNGEVLIDEPVNTLTEDSVRIMNNVPDSVVVKFKTDADWTAQVAKGGDWCTISSRGGLKGENEFTIRVDENPTTDIRKTSVVLESGTAKRIFRITQKAGEPWFGTVYWNRTAAQRAGLRGLVDSLIVSTNRFPTIRYRYHFDARGNLLSKVSDHAMYDTVFVYTYDDANHRLTCTVRNMFNDKTIRKWRYEYANTGRLVAYSPVRWDDPDPLAEDMEGMVVPDLSASYKYWIEGVYEFCESRKYTFEDDSKLVIYVDRWKNNGADSIHLESDTVRISYQYFNSSKLNLPFTSRGNVINTTYYANGMPKMLDTYTGTYEFLDNVQRPVVTAFRAKGDLADMQVEWYECTYNYNRDLLERKTQYKGVGFVNSAKFSNYKYDSSNNWNLRYEEIQKPGDTETPLTYGKQDISYFR